MKGIAEWGDNHTGCRPILFVRERQEGLDRKARRQAEAQKLSSKENPISLSG
jgi:hypothetical protein